MPADAARHSWRTPLNLAVAVQFGRDALASGYPALANEMLVPYLQDVDALLSADQVSFAQLARQARDLAEQSLRNVDDFGNPPGWVPLLSLESTLDAYLAVFSQHYLLARAHLPLNLEDAVHQRLRQGAAPHTVAVD